MKRIAAKITILALLFITFFATPAWADCHWGESSKDTKESSKSGATRPGGSIKRRRRSRMGGLLPRESKKKKKDPRRRPEADQVDREINKMRRLLWAQTHEGQKILNKLEQMNNEGRIQYKRTYKRTAKSYLKRHKLGWYDWTTKTIIIDPLPVKLDRGTCIAAVLAHEGTHAHMDTGDLWPRFADERAAYNHGYAVASQLGIPHAQRESDKTIHDNYDMVFRLYRGSKYLTDFL